MKMCPKCYFENLNEADICFKCESALTNHACVTKRVSSTDCMGYCRDCGNTFAESLEDHASRCPQKTAQRSDGSTASYYKLPAGASELQDLISHRDMNAQIGEIFRAAYRYGLASHSDKLRDARKIKFYAEAEIARLEKLAK